MPIIRNLGQHILIITSNDHCEPHGIFLRECAPCSAQRSNLHSVLGHPFQVDFNYADEIPRSKGGKFEDCCSEF